MCFKVHHLTPSTPFTTPCTDDFKGLVLKGQLGGKRPNLPGPLPRYGELAGAPYMLVAAEACQVVGLCVPRHSKLEPAEVLDADGGAGPLGAALRFLLQVAVGGWAWWWGRFGVGRCRRGCRQKDCGLQAVAMLGCPACACLCCDHGRHHCRPLHTLLPPAPPALLLLTTSFRRCLRPLQDESGGEPKQLDPRCDLKVSDVPTVEALLLRDKLQGKRAQLMPHRCPQLQEQYALVRSQVGGRGEE
jgi:hypothetical protein